MCDCETDEPAGVFTKGFALPRAAQFWSPLGDDMPPELVAALEELRDKVVTLLRDGVFMRYGDGDPESMSLAQLNRDLGAQHHQLLTLWQLHQTQLQPVPPSLLRVFLRSFLIGFCVTFVVFALLDERG